MWIVEHKSEIENAEAAGDVIVGRIDKELRKTGSKAVFEFGRSEKDGCFEFIVSADGIENQVSDVYALSRHAPKIEGWRILKFRQRESGVSLVIADVEYSNKTIRFRHRWDESHCVFHIALFIDGFEQMGNNRPTAAGWICLDKTIGEYDVMKLIGNVEFHPFGQSTSNDPPLAELAELVDSKKSLVDYDDPNQS